MNVAVVGSGYVGLVSGACLANLGHRVLCCDVDEKKISQLNRGEIPFYEPGLRELVRENLEKKRLTFTADAKQAVEFGTVILNCVGTPGKEDGSANLDFIFDVARTVARHSNGTKVIVNKSTVPPGTARRVEQLIKEQSPKAGADVVSNPEFLKEGAAIHDFNHPDRIVIGMKDPSSPAKQVMEELYAGIVRPYIEVVWTDWETAELSKYASNAFLAAKVSFINEIANICDRIGADIRTVARVMGLDDRIGPRFLNAGVGYGGSCFPKDVRALTVFAQQQGCDPQIIRQIDPFNERQKLRMAEKIVAAFSDGLAGKKIAVWGLSFKPKTSDMREAPSITIINELLKRGAAVRAYDPEAREEAKKIFAGSIAYADSPEDAARDAHALVLATEWDEFRGLDMAKVRAAMKGNLLFDGRNVYDRQHMTVLGFGYHGIGQ